MIEWLVRIDDRSVICKASGLAVQAQRERDPYFRETLRQVANAARRGDIEALARMGWEPKDQREEVAFADGFAAGLTRAEGM